MEHNITVFSQFLMSWILMSIYWLVFFIIPGAVAAYYVYQDAVARAPLVSIFTPAGWAFFCFISGAWFLLAYWVMHDSTLSDQRK